MQSMRPVGRSHALFESPKKAAMNNYDDFLQRKAILDPPTGLTDLPELNPMLFPFQRDIVRWALKRGRAAVFADCGMGKTPMQLEWAQHIPGRVLILAPLAVAAQTVREAAKFHIGDIAYARHEDDTDARIVVTNYEMLQHFDPDDFHGVVLDESGILKAYDGKTRTMLIESFRQTPFRLACTATPAPNDYMELGNHAEFLSVSSRAEMLATFFVHDGGDTSQWRLKGHAEADFWRWLCSWAVTLRKPSDLGYEDGDFELPELIMHQVTIKVEDPGFGELFPIEARTLQERLRARRDTLTDRVADCAKIVNATNEPFLIWCNLNAEGDALARLIPGSVQVSGSDSLDEKERVMSDFSEGRLRVLVSKPTICGHGLNWQHCAHQAFVGLSDSYEQFYQAVRRSWRFGQKRPVNVYVITAETEGAVVTNIKRKEQDALKMAANMVEHMKDLNQEALKGATMREKDEYTVDVAHGDGWTLHLQDCVDVARALPDDSLHYTIYSPPFASLYTYSNSDRDMGNCTGDEMFLEQYQFLVKELYRATMPGRLVSFHCMNMPTTKQNHGYIGIRDFRGDLIRLHQAEGWIYHSEVCIWKDPVTAMQRTKALGLLHKQIRKDSTMSRQGIPDYLVTMRKPGENPERVSHGDDLPVSLWQRYASPVWFDINPSDTLQFRSAREHNDERHICPLQLQVIERAIHLWSNPGDVVFSPFAGIGSELFTAIKMGRKALGAELKRSYWAQACRNLEQAKREQGGLFTDQDIA